MCVCVSVYIVCVYHLVQSLKELADWNGQCPPTAKHQKGKVITPKIKEIVGKVGPRKYTSLDTHTHTHTLHRVSPSLGRI